MIRRDALPRRRALAVSLVAVIALSLAPSRAEASPSARLAYGRAPGAEECPDEAALRQAVAVRIGYDPFFPHASRTVIVTIARKEALYGARIELIDESAHTTGARELSAKVEAGCAELLESTALAVAIAIDPRALLAPVTPEPDPEPPRREPEMVAPPVIARAAPDRPIPPPPAPNAVRLRTGAHVRVAAGLQPDIATGAFVAAAATFRHAAIGIEAGAYLPTSAAVLTSGEARAWLANAAVTPCIRFSPVELCAVGAMGRFEGYGDHVANARTTSALFLAVGARSGLEFAIAPSVHLHVTGDLLGNLARASMKIGTTEAWKAAPIAVALAAGASIDFE